MARVLVIEDDAAVRRNIAVLLEAEGYECLAAVSGENGLDSAVEHLPDLILCDVCMPGMDGFDVFERLSARPSTALIPFVFVSARAERDDVRRGMALGADDYLTKPFTRRELLDTIQARLRRRGSNRPAAVAPLEPAPALVMIEPCMRTLELELERAARGTISVLILGETGVGKEVVAEQVHARSGRSGRFVPVNCAALTESLLESELFGYEKGAFTGADKSREGLFEAAHGGTLFLDEIGELPLATQVKLLRVLEDHKVMRVGGRVARAVDVRIVAATHRDIEVAAEQGSFRKDLYYRLSGITLHVPPLRLRRADIAPLCERFIAAISCALGRSVAPLLTELAQDALQHYAWPGNIRELRNVIERAVLLCDAEEITPEHLPAKLRTRVASALAPTMPPPFRRDARRELMHEMEQLERRRIVEALDACAGNQTQAAEKLGISRRTLVTRLSQFDLPRPRKARLVKTPV
jgi:DNA-binding NtrC family response regulator